MTGTIIPKTLLDVAVLTILGISILIAMYRGFVREILAIFAWVGAGFATYFAFQHVESYFQKWISHPLIADIAAGLSVFVLVLILLSFVAHGLSSWVQKGALNTPDRFLGIVFGTVRGLLIVCCIYLLVVWSYTKKGYPEWLTQSSYVPMLQKTSEVFLTFVPEEARKKLRFDLGDEKSTEKDEIPAALLPETQVLNRPSATSVVPDKVPLNQPPLPAGLTPLNPPAQTQPAQPTQPALQFNTSINNSSEAEAPTPQKHKKKKSSSQKEIYSKKSREDLNSVIEKNID
jgi:membrane protein required for colicin V production